jgi:hypothetical protein
MTTKRRPIVRSPKQLHPLLDDWLRGGSGGAMKFLTRVPLAQIWAENRDRIVAEHIEQCPGTRPARWWQHDAPEMRKRVGGTGVSLYQAAAYGVPSYWELPFDADNPPAFEAQAAYLDRLGLLVAGERRRIPRREFEPCIVCLSEPHVIAVGSETFEVCDILAGDDRIGSCFT